MKSDRPQPLIAPPAVIRKWQTIALSLAVMLIPFFIPIPLELRRHPVISPLGDQLHVVFLAGVTLLLYWRGPLTGRLWWSALAGAAIGGAIEFVQIPVGRQANVMDFGLDLVGIGLVVGYVLWKGSGLKVGCGLILALLLVPAARLYHVPFVVAAAYRGQEIFPLLADLEGPWDRWLWGNNDANISILEIPDGPLGAGRVVRLEGGPPARWPSVDLSRFPEDWTAYTHLLLDVRVVAAPADSQRFSVRCDDFVGRKEKTWISDRFTATRTWQTFRIPLRNRRVTDGGRLQDRILDLRDVDRVVIYLPLPTAPAALEIDNLRLE